MNKTDEMDLDKAQYKYPEDCQTDKLVRRLGVTRLEDMLFYPKFFEVETINACNARCRVCSVGKWRKQKEFLMHEKLFDKFVREVSGYSNWIDTICLNRDGEPTLDKSLVKRIKMLKDSGIKKVTFATNGQLLTTRLSRELISASLDDIMLSIDAATKEVFEILRPGLDFDTVVRNMTEFIRMRNDSGSKMSIRIRMVITEENRHELNKWFDFWKPKLRTGDRIYAKPQHTWGNQIGRESEEKVDRYAAIPCISLFSTVVIKYDGRVPLCGADYNATHILGNFSHQSIKEIWNGNFYGDFRKRHIEKKRNEIQMCRGCNIWDTDAIIEKPVI